MSRCVEVINFSIPAMFTVENIIDIDECHMAALQSTVLCTNLNTQCVNTIGSFECVCVDGYELVDEECQRKIDYLKFYP